ncbi:MAG: amidohydrolase family protein [Anaerolineaceae bacterium]|nr:amidohydrolase family protein [Anaerolineaceae bacterium]
MAFTFDVHTHYTPPSMKDNLKDFAEKEPYWGLLITPDPANHTEQGWATPERMVADMDQAGVDKAIILGVYRQTPESARETNDETLAVMRRYPDRILGFGVAATSPLDKTLDEVKRCVDNGMVGMGELNPYGQGISFDDPGFLKIVEACIDADIPLNLHVSEEVGHFYLGKSTTRLLDYYHLACRYPELKLILAHWGGGLLFYEIAPEVRKNLRNVYYDMAGTPLLYPTESILKATLQCISHKKLLYCSDYPLLICPKKQHEPDFRPFLEEINAVELPEDVYADIMGRNAARLFGYLPPETSSEVAEPVKMTAVPKKSPPEIFPETVTVDPYMSISAVANAWPFTQPVFERYGLPWKDSPVPFWEPIAQAAAARGLGPSAREKLLDELNDLVAKNKGLQGV